MSMHMKLMFMGLVILTAVFKIKAAKQPPLQCWHCSSDTIGAEDFCGEEFNEDNIPVDSLKERNLSVLRYCNSSITSEHERAVCRKTVEDINGKTVVKRFCYYTNKSDTGDYCMDENKDKTITRNYCGDCWTEKCNGARMTGGSYLVSSVLCASIILLALLMTKTINV